MSSDPVERSTVQPVPLQVTGLSSGYGSDVIIQDVHLTLGSGEAIAVLGPNGAGKTTLLRTVSGVIKPRRGEILMGGKPIGGSSPHSISRGGLGHVPEGRGIFPGLTVRENLALGRFAAHSRIAAQTEAISDGVLEVFPQLKTKLKQLAGTLSGGEQQMLAIGRALMGEPKVLLLDEPSLGLAPLVTERVYAALVTIRSRGVAVLVVEQNIGHVLNFADRGYVMNRGEVVMEGTVAALKDADVFGAYLAAL